MKVQAGSVQRLLTISCQDLGEDLQEWPLPFDADGLYAKLGLENVLPPKVTSRIASDGFVSVAHCKVSTHSVGNKCCWSMCA
jgi:hypothetical protein